MRRLLASLVVVVGTLSNIDPVVAQDDNKAKQLEHAKKSVEKLRKGEFGGHPTDLGNIEDAIRAGIPMESIGVTKEDLKKFERGGVAYLATHTIKAARERILSFDTYWIDRAIGLGVTLKELGTDEAELKKLEKGYRQEEAKRRIKLARSEKKKITTEYWAIDMATDLGVTEAELGLTAEEKTEIKEYRKKLKDSLDKLPGLRSKEADELLKELN